MSFNVSSTEAAGSTDAANSLVVPISARFELGAGHSASKPLHDPSLLDGRLNSYALAKLIGPVSVKFLPGSTDIFRVAVALIPEGRSAPTTFDGVAALSGARVDITGGTLLLTPTVSPVTPQGLDPQVKPNPLTLPRIQVVIATARSGGVGPPPPNSSSSAPYIQIHYNLSVSGAGYV